jgi:hypothetical protein
MVPDFPARISANLSQSMLIIGMDLPFQSSDLPITRCSDPLLFSAPPRLRGRCSVFTHPITKLSNYSIDGPTLPGSSQSSQYLKDLAPNIPSDVFLGSRFCQLLFANCQLLFYYQLLNTNYRFGYQLNFGLRLDALLV